jgi:hypothetical protein
LHVEQYIEAWKRELTDKCGLSAADAQELEDHLRDEMTDLTKADLSEDEALLIALRRMGEADTLASELAIVHSDRLWKHLQITDTPPNNAAGHELLWVLVAAFTAALLSKIPMLFGISFSESSVYGVNAGLFVIPVLIVGCYALRRFPINVALFGGGMILAALAAVNLYPLTPESNSTMLTALHLPLLLWLVFGVAYTGGDWRSTRPVWDFIRFTGEFVVYAAILGLGGIVFTGLTITFFAALGLPAERFIIEYVALSGLFAMPIVAAYLVEKKRSIIENMAPVLARVFIPLFLTMTIVFIGFMFIRLPALYQDRDLLIAIDVLLMLVTGMCLYDLSARDLDQDTDFTGIDLMSLALIVSVLVIDVLALSGILSRLFQYGFSLNKTAALGENILLLLNLGGLAYFYIRFALGKATRRCMQKWQVVCMPAYFVWLVVVVFILPVLYKFI